MPKIECPVCSAVVTVDATWRLPSHVDRRPRFHGRRCPAAGTQIPRPPRPAAEQNPPATKKKAEPKQEPEK